MHHVEFIKSASRSGEYPRITLPMVAFAGRSNVGKSSVINRLVGRKNVARISSTPGRTQIINFFSVDQRWLLVDLPGYGYAKVPERIRRNWMPMMEEFFRESAELKMTLLIVDARHEPGELDHRMVEWLDSLGVSIQVVANKLDKLSKSRRAPSVDLIREHLSVPEVIPFSAVTGEGRQRIWSLIESSVSRDVGRWSRVGDKVVPPGRPGSPG